MYGKSINSEIFFREIVIADLADFQILVPTDIIKISKKNNPLNLPKKQRIYSKQGWVHLNDQIIGQVQGLRIQSIANHNFPFKINPRISSGIPVSFEISTSQPLPQEISGKALFRYQFEELPGFYYAMFQNIKPRFVRIYTLQLKSTLLEQIQQFFSDKEDFIREHYAQLKNVDFYRKQFHL